MASHRLLQCRKHPQQQNGHKTNKNHNKPGYETYQERHCGSLVYLSSSRNRGRTLQKELLLQSPAQKSIMGCICISLQIVTTWSPHYVCPTKYGTSVCKDQTLRNITASLYGKDIVSTCRHRHSWWKIPVEPSTKRGQKERNLAYSGASFQ